MGVAHIPPDDCLVGTLLPPCLASVHDGNTLNSMENSQGGQIPVMSC